MQYILSARVYCASIIILFIHFALQNFRLHAYILVLWPCLLSKLKRLRYPGPVYGYGWYTRTCTRKSVKYLQLKKSKTLRGTKTNQRMVVFVVKIHQKLFKTLTDIYALSIWLRCWSILLLKRPTNSKQKAPVPVYPLRVDHGLPRRNG